MGTTDVPEEAPLGWKATKGAKPSAALGGQRVGCGVCGMCGVCGVCGMCEGRVWGVCGVCMVCGVCVGSVCSICISLCNIYCINICSDPSVQQRAADPAELESQVVLS